MIQYQKHLMLWLLALLVSSLLVSSSAATSFQSSSRSAEIATPQYSSNSGAGYSSPCREEILLVNDVTIDETGAQATGGYDDRKKEWERRYTSLKSLRTIFGGNRNIIWGDLDPGSARRLYCSLMPRVLMELVKVGVHPEDLAPLAYKARVAAKLYSRERSTVPARLAATVYDGIRQFKRYRRIQPHGMTYDQLWDKYHKVVMNDPASPEYEDLTERDIVTRICLKIVERSCCTNGNIDRKVLPAVDVPQRALLRRVAATLEKDVRKLLSEYKRTRKTSGKDRALSRRLETRKKMHHNRMKDEI